MSLKPSSHANTVGKYLPFVLHMVYRSRKICFRLCKSSPSPVIRKEKYNCLTTLNFSFKLQSEKTYTQDRR